MMRTYAARGSALALLLASTFATAASINRAGESPPESDSARTAGSFMTRLILVADDAELFAQWALPSKIVEVKPTDIVRVNGSINAFVIFGGCTIDKVGQCSVAMRFRVLQPDGAVYAETPAMEVWHAKSAPTGRSLELSVEYLKIVIEPTDLLGPYEVQAQVRDNNSGTVLQLKAPFRALKAE